ncbi:MAG: preprotein translocase subunit SecA [Campylobacterota bacterium]
MIQSVFGKIFGTRNDRMVKKYFKRVKEVNALEEQYKAMSDAELQEAFAQLRDAVKAGEKSMEDVLPESFAITREASVRVLDMRPFDVQILGAMVLHENMIAEMKTGEGKTLVATLPVALNAMEGKGVHVVTVNDYLAKRDAADMGKLYAFLGYSVGCISGDIDDEAERKAQYDCDITYGTNNEYGFDYLRDNMKFSREQMVQREYNYAIVDEVDSILIDEARTPLIISGPVNRRLENYQRANDVAMQLEKGEQKPTKPGEPEEFTGDFIVDEKNNIVLLTEEGTVRAQELFGVENLYDLQNAGLAHHLDQALKANYLFVKDKDYVVKNNEVVIVDEFTGRLSEGRRFSEGLHQAIEAKEGVEIKQESQTLADITFQNYFRMYDKLAGMTGTAQTEATEFSQIYKLDVVSIPTNKPIVRDDKNDLIYKTEGEKFNAIIEKITQLHKKGQPVLIGTASIEKSELIHKFLKKNKVPHNVLNAKNHEKEASIIENAGNKGAITVATNMAGRGVDIKIDQEVKDLGGLFILGTERHESRRIDNQLRGRAGRQGDPGATQFYLSLEDNLLRIFGSDRIRSIMDRLGVKEGEHIESKMVTRAVENAQKKVEGMHFESRKHLLEYDDVANEQRKTIYTFRKDLIKKAFDIKEKIHENMHEYIAHVLTEAGIMEDIAKEDFDLQTLQRKIKEELNLDLSLSEDMEYEEIKSTLETTVIDTYEEKMAQVDENQREEIERTIYLQTLDGQWRDHLYQMDTLKEGIRLRGYNQKDPLVEYKKESFNMFLELVESIKYEAVKTLVTIQFRFEQQEKEQQALDELKKQMDESVEGANEGPAKVATQAKKPKRNEPCPCGSGKKYKHCCGKSGPKRGMLADES